MATLQSIDELIVLNEKLSSYAEKYEVKEVEMFFEYSKTLQIIISGHSIVNERETEELGFSSRIINNGSQGFAYSNKTSFEELKKCVDDAVAISKVAPQTPDISLPEIKTSYPSISNLYSSDLANIDVEFLINQAREFIEPLKTAPVEVKVDLSKVQLTESWIGIVNSLGIKQAYKTNLLHGEFFMIARDGEKVGSFIDESFFTRNPKSVNLPIIGQNMIQKAVDNLNVETIPSLDSDTVIFNPDAVANPIAFVIALAVSSKNVQKNRSLWKDSLAEQVAVDSFSLTDNPHNVEGGIGAKPFDMEGTATKPVDIIKDGMLETFLFDELHAKRAKTESTGHCTRSMGGKQFSAPPREVFPHSMFIHPGDMKFDEMIEDTKLGIIFDRFSGSTRMENGIFSGVAKGVKLIENGEITKPLTNISIAGNVFDLLKNIDGIADKQRLTHGFLTTPCIKAKKVSITTESS